MQIAHTVNSARYTTNEILRTENSIGYAVFCPYGQKTALSPAILSSVWMENSVWSHSLPSLGTENSRFATYSSVRMDGR